MRLISHNLLKCNIRGLTAEQGYPLRIEADKTEVVPSDFSADFMRTMLKKVNLAALKAAATDLSLGQRVHALESLDEASALDEELLRELHNLLFEVQVMDGWLVCPTTGRKFPVKDGIPNMLLHEDEV